MIGIGLVFSRRASKSKNEFAIAMPAVYTVALIYLMFYFGMGMQMTWLFFWGSLAAAILAGLWGSHLLNRYEGSARAVFVLMGILSFLTVCIGGYVREASRPRFVSPDGQRASSFNRISSFDYINRPEEREASIDFNIIRGEPNYVDELERRPERQGIEPETVADLVSSRCITCHTLERIHVYKDSDWDRVVGRMRAYGTKLTNEETQNIVNYLNETQSLNRSGAGQD